MSSSLQPVGPLTPPPTLLALDIGAKTHAFAWEHADHREAGTLVNEPAAIR